MEQLESTILVVDDEPALREIFRGWLESLKIGRVLTACDGVHALAILQEAEVALLVTDVRMPRMNGTMLVRQLATLSKAPSIVIVSTSTDVNERELYELGAASFLSKPLRREDLTRAALAALARREELWKEKPLRAPRQEVLIAEPGFGEQSFRLGRGGFCGRIQGTVVLGKVGFACHVGDGHTVLRGAGIVRWRSRLEGLVGVEFTYLDESSRACVIDGLQAKRPLCFIPSNLG